MKRNLWSVLTRPLDGRLFVAEALLEPSQFFEKSGNFRLRFKSLGLFFLTVAFRVLTASFRFLTGTFRFVTASLRFLTAPIGRQSIFRFLIQFQ